MGSLNFGRVSPSFLIIGAQKAGTSSLHTYLTQHQDLVAATPKELHYFDQETFASKADYLGKFPKCYLNKKIAFEATPRYLYYPLAARRIYEFKADMKLIAILRDPVDRAFSAWNMFRQMAEQPQRLERFQIKEQSTRWEKMYSFLYADGFPSFRQWVHTELDPGFDATILEPSIVRRGYYKNQLENYLQYFNRNQLLLLDFQELAVSPYSSLEKVTEFLGIRPFKQNQINLNRQNKRSYINAVDDTTRTELAAHYRHQNEGLDKLLGWTPQWLKDNR